VISVYVLEVQGKNEFKLHPLQGFAVANSSSGLFYQLMCQADRVCCKKQHTEPENV